MRASAALPLRLGVPLESLAFKMRADGFSDDDIEHFVELLTPHAASLDDRRASGSGRLRAAARLTLTFSLSTL